VFHYVLAPGFLRITDTRQGEGRYVHLAGLHHDVLLLCDEINSIRRLKEQLQDIYPEEVNDGALEEVVEELKAAGLLMQEENQLLALPIGYRPRTTEELTNYVLGTDSPPESGSDCLQVIAAT
jgi:hypothetical protein